MSQQKIDPKLQHFKESFLEAARVKDRPALQAMLHIDYMFISPVGEIYLKQRLIDTIVHAETNFLDTFFKRAEKEIAISVSGNTVTEAADVEIRGDLRGEDKTGKYINTATFVNGSNGWQILGNSITRKLVDEGHHTQP